MDVFRQLDEGRLNVALDIEQHRVGVFGVDVPPQIAALLRTYAGQGKQGVNSGERL